MPGENDRAAPSHAWAALMRGLVGEPELTSTEVAEMAGVDLQQAGRLWLALGFPPVSGDERVFARSDVAMLAAVRRMLEAYRDDPDVLVQLTRVSGQALARVAEAQVQAASFDNQSFERLRQHPLDLDEAGARAAVEEITGSALALEPFLSYVWRRHLLASLVRVAATAAADPEAAHVTTVGFADMVGFTALSQTMDEHELAALVAGFEAHAFERIARGGGRVIKMIGDEVMFAVDDAASGAELALALHDAFAADEALPEVRIGIASGPTLSWEGDLFGPTVNLAGRLVGLARPDTVLVSESIAEAIGENPAFALRRMRPTRLKGIGRVRVWALRRVGQEPPPRRRRLRVL